MTPGRRRRLACRRTRARGGGPASGRSWSRSRVLAIERFEQRIGVVGAAPKDPIGAASSFAGPARFSKNARFERREEAHAGDLREQLARIVEHRPGALSDSAVRPKKDLLGQMPRILS